MTDAMETNFWQGKRVFLTGHTGFKGSWLALWLQSLGAEVKGFSLDMPSVPSLFEQANVVNGMESEIGDIRNIDAIVSSIRAFNPDILFHMAAQPLVRHSYIEPVETYATNVMGTVHVLEAARQAVNLKAIVNVTTDKCYENEERIWGYREVDPMGGHDPYSNSKGCAELVTSAYRKSFFNNDSMPALASARAGNVIGGGDWAVDRLIPDVLRAFENKTPVMIRNALATRPWQHVLEPLSGYLNLAEKLYRDSSKFAEGWNFGPRDEDVWPVEKIVNHLVKRWGGGASWELDGSSNPHEASLLKLDISKATVKLNWKPRWPLEQALDSIIDWHQCWLDQQNMREKTLSQIQEYCASHSNGNS